MKFSCLLFLFFGLLTIQLNAQIDTSKLDKKEVHFIGQVYAMDINGVLTYSINGKTISKEEYDKKYNAQKIYEECAPCYLRTFKNQALVSEGTFYKTCPVDRIVNYDTSGKISSILNFMTNAEKGWITYSIHNCGSYHGSSYYMDSTGDTLYQEIWEEGQFIRQVPEQKINKVWKVDITSNGYKIGDDPIDLREVENLLFKFHYKNSSAEKTIPQILTMVDGKRLHGIIPLTAEHFKTLNLKNNKTIKSSASGRLVKLTFYIYTDSILPQTIELLIKV